MTALFAVRLTLPGTMGPDQLAQFELVFSELLDSVATSHLRDTGDGRGADDWHIEALFQFLPDEAVIAEMLAPVCAAAGIAPVDVVAEPVAERDWLAENRAAFPPLRIGRFWIYGNHVETTPPVGSTPLLIEAAQAFGSGTHPTTEGCLRALEMVAVCDPHRPKRVLDMGCGSAILGMAAAKIWPDSCIMAADNDPVAVRVAAQNLRLNAIAPAAMRCVVSAGFAGRDVRRNGPYNLIFANILAGPLRRMARSLMPHLAPGGWLILSGILNEQATAVERAYAAQGARCWAMLQIGEWTTIILRPSAWGTMPALWQGRNTSASAKRGHK